MSRKAPERTGASAPPNSLIDLLDAEALSARTVERLIFFL
jgi:hypothetical protein